jgi:hypothetical protein
MANLEHNVRQYDFSTAQQVVVGAASARSTAIPFEEILVVSSTACFIRVGNSSVVATTGAGSMPMAANEKLSIRIPMGSFVAVIQSAAAGTLTIIPIQL